MATSFWVALGLGFSGAIFGIYEAEWVINPTALSPGKAVTKYLTGYLIELSLSVDNLFVIAMIFNALRIPIAYQHRTLFWGILGAIVFRGAMIVVGVALINSISWMTYVFGAFLIYTAFRMLKEGDEGTDQSKYLSRLERFLPMTTRMQGEHFWIVEEGVRKATPLFAALVLIEISDLLFALDSIPAILAVTTDPFLVFSSNIFAILGLRSMYFFLADLLERFQYLKYSVFAILIFVGVKLLLIHHVEFPEWLSLGVILIALLAGILFSLYKKGSLSS